MIRSLWASVQGDPVFMRRVNGWLTIFWMVLVPIAWATGWVNSPAFISYLSMIALVLGSWSAWQAARVEVTQMEQAAEAERRSLPDEVVEAVVEKTNIEKQE